MRVTAWAAQGCRLLGRVMVAGALLATLLPAPVARAQFAMPGADRGPADLNDLAVSRESMSAYCSALGLGEAQRQLALELHSGYLENHRQMARRFEQRSQRVQREIRETRDVAGFREQMPAIMRELMTRMQELEEGVFLDLRTLAGVAESDDRWAEVQRMRRREQAAHTPSLNGDAVDLVKLVRELDGMEEGPPPGVAAALLRYELELDVTLAERQRLVRSAMASTADLMEAQFDPQRQAEAARYWEDLLDKTQELSRRAKATNARCAAEIEQLLEGELRSGFARAVQRATWPGVYGEAYPERLLAAAKGMADVTDDQMKQLAAIEREYQGQAAAANSRWARLIDEREASAEGPLGGFVGFGADEESDEGRAKRQRAELDRSAIERITLLLTPAQQARLPGEQDADGEDDG